MFIRAEWGTDQMFVEACARLRFSSSLLTTFLDPSSQKSLVTCNSLLSSLLEWRRDAFIVHLAPNHRLLYELAVNPPVNSTQTPQGTVAVLALCPSTHLQKPPF